MMYDRFNKHLSLGHKSPVEEQPFVPVPPAELSVYTKEHPRPADSVNAERLRQYLTTASDEQLAAMQPTDAAKLAEYRRVWGPALRVMLGSSLPEARQVEAKEQGEPSIEGLSARGYLIGRRGQGEQVPALWVQGKEFNGTVVVWVDPKGKASVVEGGKLAPAARAILDGGGAVLAVDVFGTGELTPEKPMVLNPRFAGYTFGYNRPLLSQRCHDVLTAVGFARGQKGVKKTHLLGRGKAGPWALLARGLAGDAVARTAADADQFRFEKVRAVSDEMMLPGALKYGGLPALAALAAPAELLVHNASGTGTGRGVKAAYKAAGAEEQFTHHGEKVEEAKVVAWLMR
jgi:hypothetical protein